MNNNQSSYTSSMSTSSSAGYYNYTGSYINTHSYAPQLGISQNTNITVVCEDYSLGYCEHGENCRFVHLLKLLNGHYMVVNRPNDVMKNAIISANLCPEKLEKEFVELLKARRGIPVPIASLPIVYQDKFRKLLPVQSSNLIRLLARMQSSIHVIDKPHGMPAIILEDDYMRYMKFVEDREKHGSGFPNESHICLTFPQRNNISERDVENYFACFGMVQEVQILAQGMNMYGFVTFVYPETASLVLSMYHHYICGLQVMVNPYRYKPVLDDRNISFDAINVVGGSASSQSRDHDGYSLQRCSKNDRGKQRSRR